MERGWYVTAFDVDIGAIISDYRASPWPGCGSNSIAFGRFQGATAQSNLRFNFTPVTHNQAGQSYKTGGHPGFLLRASGYRVKWDFFTESFGSQPRWTLEDMADAVGTELQVRGDSRLLRYWDGDTANDSDYAFSSGHWYRFDLVDVDVLNKRSSLNVYRWDTSMQQAQAVFALRDKEFQNPVDHLQRFVMRSWSSSNFLYFLDNFSLSLNRPVDLAYTQWRRERFGVSAAGKPEVNADKTGMPDLMRFALSQDESSPFGVRLPELSFHPGDAGRHLDFTIYRNSEAIGLDWVVEVAIDLSNWEERGEGMRLLENSSSKIKVRESVSEGPPNTRFMQWRVRSTPSGQ
ncbi:MAG: hypothetical protein JJU20_14785 [Opitutales bacterium]|nr:hypothetical protein [Opitutales bacterium]